MRDLPSIFSLLMGGVGLKKERIKKKIYKNRQLAIDDISDYIESFYNRTRRHLYLGGVSPDEFEEAAKRSKPGVH